MIATLEKHQLALFIVFLPLVFKMAMLPCLLFQVAGSDMWISVLIMLLFEIVQVGVILGIQKLGGMERLKKVLGPRWTSLVILPFLFVFLAKGTVYFNEIVGYVSSFLFYNVEDWSIRIALLIGIAYLALKGVKAMGRIGELALLFIPFILVIGLSFGKVDLHFDYILPIFEDGAAPVFEGVWKYMFYAFDFSPLIFIGIAEKKKSPPPAERGLNLNINHRKKTIPWFAISSVLALVSVVGVYLLFIASYGDSAYLIDNAFARLASFNVVTTEIGSIDWPAVVLWILMAIISVSLKVWGSGVVVNSFGLKRGISIVGVSIALWALSTYVLKNVTVGTEFLESGWRFAVVGVEVAATLLIFGILAYAKAAQKTKGKKEAKNAA